MKPYKIAINWAVLFCSTVWVFYAFPKLREVGDFYWWTLIPTSMIFLAGWGLMIVLGIMKWFDI